MLLLHMHVLTATCTLLCRQQATSLASDLLGLLRSCPAAQQAQHWQQLAACVLQLAAAQQQHGGSIAELCRLLGAAHSSQPGLLQQHAVLLALLSLESSRADTPALLALLYKVLSGDGSDSGSDSSAGAAGGQQQGAGGVAAADAALVLHPAACLLALGTYDKAKRWGAHLLALLVELQEGRQQAAAAPAALAAAGAGQQWTGELAQMQHARAVLHSLWGESDGSGAADSMAVALADGSREGGQGGGGAAAVAWCQALAASLSQARAKRWGACFAALCCAALRVVL